jgi:hypothetical protein
VIEIPQSLEGTRFEAFLLYFTLIHEVEHGIQARKTVDVNLYLNGVDPWIESRFLKELGAMRAEWRFLNTLTDYDRKVFVEEIGRSGLPKPDKENFSRWVLNSKLELDEYLFREHQAGRYNFRSLRAYATAATGEPQPFLSTKLHIGVFIALGVILKTQFCDSVNLKDIPKDRLNFYQEICPRLFFSGGDPQR